MALILQQSRATETLSLYAVSLRLAESVIELGKYGAGVTVSFFPSQFFTRGKNGPAHSFPGEKTDRSVFSPGERFD